MLSEFIIRLDQSISRYKNCIEKYPGDESLKFSLLSLENVKKNVLMEMESNGK